MKILSKISPIIILVIVVFGVGAFFAPAQAADCITWSLLWDKNGTSTIGADVVSHTAGSPVDTFLLSGAPNTISEGSPAFDPKTKPGEPSALPESSWKCTNPPASVITAQDQQLAQGTVACQRAVQLSAQYGRYTALDDAAGKLVKDKVLSFLQQSTNSFGINIDLSNLKGIYDSAGKLSQEFIDKYIGNPMKAGVAAQSSVITTAAQDEFNKIFKLGSIATGISSILGVGQTVPVSDAGVSDKLDKVTQAVNNVVIQQKQAQVIQDTRDRCNELLKSTGATIKKALLYQLSTQIVDWIQNGQTPQFIKQPGVFLKDTGKLALDRFISRVAPRLCQPFQFAIQLQIPTVARESNPFYEQVTCSLSQVTNNIEGFYNDFRQGGWLTYQEMWKPQNNYYGALLMTQEAAAQVSAAATQAANADMARGNGFTSQSRCIEWQKFEPQDPSFTGPPTIMQDLIGYNSTDTQGPQDNGGLPETGLTQDQTRPNQYWDKNNAYFWECEKSEITNPGTVTANLANKASSADLDYLINTDDVENFLQTIQDSIVNKLVKSGVNGFRKLLPTIIPPIKP